MRDIVLFYEDFERDSFVRGDRRLKRLLRRGWHRLKGVQRVTGFEVAFRALVTALRRAGHRVRVNDFLFAWTHPRHPIGVAGYPHVLDRWSLRNPAILGPGLYDHPAQAPHLMNDPRFRGYVVSCAWMRELFAPFYGERVFEWYAGIDVDAWPDFARAPKDIDVLVYDKVHWDRARMQDELMAPVMREMERRALRCEVLRYGKYDHAQYRALLERSRALLWLSEHETQGLAYQEAMACNVPVLAWDQGKWLDPNRAKYGAIDVKTSSVPWFDARCGERFRDAADFPAALDRFLEGRDRYAPRDYVRSELSLAGSARIYADRYFAAAR